MANNVAEKLRELMETDGALGVCVVDLTNGMILGKEGGGVDLDMAAAGNTQVVRAKLATMKSLGIKGAIEDILITLDKQFHIIRPCHTYENLFIYFVLDKSKANLAMARYKAADVDKGLVV